MGDDGVYRGTDRATLVDPNLTQPRRTPTTNTKRGYAYLQELMNIGEQPRYCVSPRLRDLPEKAGRRDKGLAPALITRLAVGVLCGFKGL